MWIYGISSPLIIAFSGPEQGSTRIPAADRALCEHQAALHLELHVQLANASGAIVRKHLQLAVYH